MVEMQHFCETELTASSSILAVYYIGYSLRKFGKSKIRHSLPVIPTVGHQTAEGLKSCEVFFSLNQNRKAAGFCSISFSGSFPFPKEKILF